jgi:hypothetical protein
MLQYFILHNGAAVITVRTRHWITLYVCGLRELNATVREVNIHTVDYCFRGHTTYSQVMPRNYCTVRMRVTNSTTAQLESSSLNNANT